MILKNCRIFDGNSFIKDTAVLLENDKIIKTLSESELSAYSGEDTLDLNNAVLSPGFIDLQLIFLPCF